MDKIIRAITHEGSFLIAAIDSTELACVAQQVHGLSATASAVLGRALTGASIMGAMLKQEKATVTLKFNGGGPIGDVVAISDSKGNVRGFVNEPDLELPIRADGKLDVSGAVGVNGRLGIIRDYGTGEPYVGQIELVSGEIAEDITNYYARSEQVPTVCALGVLVDKDTKNVLLAGGLLIQALPGVFDEELTKLEKNLETLEPVTTMLAKGMTPLDMMNAAMKGFDIDVLDEMPVHYACTCSKEKYAAALMTLGKKEILSLPFYNGNVEAVCPYCSKKYLFNREEIAEIAEKAVVSNK